MKATPIGKVLVRASYSPFPVFFPVNGPIMVYVAAVLCPERPFKCVDAIVMFLVNERQQRPRCSFPITSHQTSPNKLIRLN